MKKIIIVAFIAITGFFSLSCEEYLASTPAADGFLKEDVFSDYLTFRQFLDGVYPYLHDYLAPFDYAWIGALGDEGYLNSAWETMGVARSGDWLRAFNTGQALQFYRVWEGWEGVRRCNIALEEIPTLVNSGQLENGSVTQTQIDELEGQAHFMRAWFHYEFLRRQGGMPYITEVYEASDDFSRARLSYNETALRIAADCDSAMALLPESWNSANLGRPTRGAAMALKASALLHSASPANNPSNDQTRWELAAQAAWDLIDFAQSTGRYSLMPSNGTDQIQYDTPGGIQTITFPSGFDSIFMYTPLNENSEIIWENYQQSTTGNGTYTVLTVPSIEDGGIIQGFSPSHNIVERFETANGLALEDDPGFDPQNPYVNRDPRFYYSILFNNEIWTSVNRPLELFVDGQDRDPTNQFSNHTGYLSRKFWNRNVDAQSDQAAPLTHKIYFRYAEILLMYAEACNEIGGPSYTLPGANMSALDAVNMVRNRVGQPDVPAQYTGSADDFRERIRNERVVELYLEGKRVFDLMRYGTIGNIENRSIYAINLVENPGAPTGFDIQPISTPYSIYQYSSKHTRFPIPLEDALIFDDFSQNPGW